MGSPQLETLLRRLANVRKISKGYMASCPAHGGHDCLTVSEGDNGAVLVHCFAGCDTRDVVEAVDLRLSDLFADSLNPERQREYRVSAARDAQAKAKLIMDIAAAQMLEDGAEKMSKEDLATLADAQEKFKAAAELIEELEGGAPSDCDADTQTENRFLSRLSFDSDAALDALAGQQWILDQIIPKEGFGVLYGASGTYKSFLTLSIAASVSSGAPWYGFDADNPGQVIYIAAEGAAGLHARKKAYEIRHKTTLPRLGILADAPVINSATDCQQLIEACEAVADEYDCPIRLIVVDTLARTFAGEENSASDMSAFINACGRITRKTGASILVIHHSGKDLEKGARGSSALRAACDFELKVSAEGKRKTKLTCSKAKDTDPFGELTFALDVVELGRNDAKGRQMKSLVPRLVATSGDDEGDDEQKPEYLPPNANKLNDLIASVFARSGQDFVTKPFLLDEWRRIVGGNPNSARETFRRAMDELCAKSWITVDDGGIIRRSEKF